MSNRASLKAALVLLAALCIAVAGDLPAAPVPAPQWVGVYDVTGRAGLLWIKATNIARYKVFRRRADETTFTLIGQTEGNRYSDEAIQPRITYYYRLVGITAEGQESSPSAEIPFTLLPKVKEALSTPRWEGSIILDKGIGLKWEQLDPTQVVAYNIYRTTLPDGKEELLASSRENFFTDYQVSVGRKYRYRVTALDNNFKETPPSGETLVTFERRRVEEVGKSPVYPWIPRRTYLIKSVQGGAKSLPLRAPSDVALSPQGLLFVADSGNGLIQVFSKDGDYRYDFQVPAEAGSPPPNPLGLAVDKEGKVWCTDAYSGRVMIFSPRGNLLGSISLPRDNPTAPFGLLDLAIGPQGTVWVVDNFNHRVAVFSGTGDFTGWLGRPGLAPGELSAPAFCAVDAEGKLLVTEALSARLQIFGAKGEFVRAFGRSGPNVGSFARPKGVAVDSRGRIYVADSWLCQIQAFDENGRFLFILADEQGKPLDLGSPNGIHISVAENNIYIAERLANRVQIRHIQDD